VLEEEGKCWPGSFLFEIALLLVLSRGTDCCGHQIS
jgi:hypothetical protein